MKTGAYRLLSLPLELAKASGSSFTYSFLLLPPPKRRAIISVYKFCRVIDDAVDGQAPSQNPAEALDAWRRQIDLSYRGTPRDPLAAELAGVVQRFPIPQEYFQELIDGVEMDLVHRRYETFDELYPYCYRVASVVGLICIEIFGYRNPATKSYATHLGVALQLTNILRDLREDGLRDRIYLPRADLEKFGYSETDLLRSVYNERFRALMKFECGRVREYFQSARSILPMEDEHSLVAARAMAAIYYCLLKRIERLEYDVFTRRVEVPRPRRLAIALATWAQSMYHAKTSNG